MQRNLRNEQDTVVTHKHRVVQKHYIEFGPYPAEPDDDQEAFVILAQGQRIAYSPRDFQQFVACLLQVQQNTTPTG